MLCSAASLSMRRIRPVSTLPGPHSMYSVAPWLRKRVSQVPAHADRLRTLTRKHQGPARHAPAPYHSRTVAPHVNPPPNTTKSTMSPFFTRPHRTASSRATGTDAAEMLPTRSRFT